MIGIVPEYRLRSNRGMIFMAKTGESLYESRTFKEVSGEWLSGIRDRIS